MHKYVVYIGTTLDAAGNRVTLLSRRPVFSFFSWSYHSYGSDLHWAMIDPYHFNKIVDLMEGFHFNKLISYHSQRVSVLLYLHDSSTTTLSKPYYNSTKKKHWCPFDTRIVATSRYLLCLERSIQLPIKLFRVYTLYDKYNMFWSWCWPSSGI